jgi:fatty-acyl-CoA synthase
VFKPRLRMLACERVLQERLDRAGLLGPVQVKVEDAGSGLSARFEKDTGAAPADAKERIAELMRPFAIDWRFTGADSRTG